MLSCSNLGCKSRTERNQKKESHFTRSIGPKSNLVQIFGALNEKYGPIVKMDGTLSKPTVLLLFEPELYEQVFRAEETNPLRPGFAALTYYREELRKSTFKDVAGLITAQGESWRRFRTTVNPALLKIKLLKLYEPAMEEIAEDMVDRLLRLQNKGDYLKQYWDSEMINWALESVAFMAMDVRLGCLNDNLGDDHPSKQLIKCAKDILDLSFRLEIMPTSIWKRFSTKTLKKLVNAFDLQWGLTSNYIAKAKIRINERGYDIPEEDKTIVEKLLAVDETVAIMMANEMLLAGIDTVAFTVTTLLYHLATHPDKQEKVRQGLLSETPSKQFLRACMKESLRLSPIVSVNVRRTGKEHIVAGYHVPKGIDVIAPNEIVTNSEKFFPKAKEYVPERCACELRDQAGISQNDISAWSLSSHAHPERWIADKSDPLYYGNAHPMASSPFGFGIRSCIGRRIAELEMETFVEKLLRRVRVSWEGPPLQTTTRIMKVHVKPFGFRFEAVK